jgi:predicted HicB family RNase H-like nuclease
LKVGSWSLNVFEDSVSGNEEVTDESNRLGENIRGDGQANYREIRATAERGATWEATASRKPTNKKFLIRCQRRVHMNRTVCFMMAVRVSLNLFNGPLHAAQPAFEGKTIRIVVGFSAGGGFDIKAHFGNAKSHLAAKPGR